MPLYLDIDLKQKSVIEGGGLVDTVKKVILHWISRGFTYEFQKQNSHWFTEDRCIKYSCHIIMRLYKEDTENLFEKLVLSKNLLKN